MLIQMEEYEFLPPVITPRWVRSESYVGTMCYVSCRLHAGKPVIKSTNNSDIVFSSSFLVGIFVGKEIKPRFLLFRKDVSESPIHQKSSYYFYYKKGYAENYNVEKASDKDFEVGLDMHLGRRFWRIQ